MKVQIPGTKKPPRGRFEHLVLKRSGRG